MRRHLPLAVRRAAAYRMRYYNIVGSALARAIEGLQPQSGQEDDGDQLCD